ncbi:signal recognition particle-docking protein FtsY [Feifania hominis]|uniref:Signal recognition particle receptor FtsY n=1 Tax=Feifania hominis TaxID=2763660 RepID=A0A926DCR5_9FIRM|nr:signal recognition particle-docking protein FtsY [Feifania hominis]MBC8535708.1 signal recognition particle-docking protein FtsY [Feifania hominis]
MGFFDKIKSVLSGFKKIDEDLYEELEETLILADIGVESTEQIMQSLRQTVKEQRTDDPQSIRDFLKQIIFELLDGEHMEETYPRVILVMGVNGVGKTTTIGKLAHYYQKLGKKVILGAADTFRAAAIDQLEVWAERTGSGFVRHQEGSDPAAVVFDTLAAGKSRGSDVIICDTAGRLHNKKNLMDELAKIARIISREYPDAESECLLVLDATTGQNGVNQAREFKSAGDVTGIVLTKMDGTAKGGIVIAIKNELEIPVRYVGFGEGIDDLKPFDAREFTDALFE